MRPLRAGAEWSGNAGQGRRKTGRCGFARGAGSHKERTSSPSYSWEWALGVEVAKQERVATGEAKGKAGGPRLLFANLEFC